MSGLFDLVGEILGLAVGAIGGAIEGSAKEYSKYTKSGKYHEDYSTGSSRSKNMSDRALYDAMSNKKRSAGERIAYKDELKKRGH